MRRAWRYAPVALATLFLGLAGCASGGGTPTATPTPSPTPAAACPYGDWRSTQVAASGGGAGVTVTLQGGSGVTMSVAQGGAVTADFTAMQPITFTGQAAGAEVRGEFSYRGPLSGNLDLTGGTTGGPSTVSPGGAASATATAGPVTPDASASPSAGPTGGTGTSGPWQPTGQVTMTDLTVTVKITAPLTVTVADNVKVSDITGAQTSQVGNAVDLQPLLRPGQYSCAGDQLTVALSGGTAPPVTWTFGRA
jgi:hypothetical protein